MPNTVTILGLNGRIGQETARAFVAAGWTTIGMARTDKVKIPGVRFFKGDAENPGDVAAACAPSSVVVNAINLPYDKWDKGRYEANLGHVLDGLKGSGKTLLFPGNIYNYPAKQHLITPDTPQLPEKDKGEIRVRLEQMLGRAATGGNLQVLILRCPDFFGPGATGTMFDLAMLADIAKNKLTYPGDPKIGHSWAYLPDVARAFVRIAEERQNLPQFESLHFAGHFKTGTEMIAAISAVLPRVPHLKRLPWSIVRVMGLVMPLMREVAKMSYLWAEPTRLADEKLDALLGPGFLTPFGEAVARTTKSYLPPLQFKGPIALNAPSRS